MANFFAFLKSRGEPETGWSVWAVLAYFQHKRPELITLYDIRVAKQNKLDDKSDKAGRKSHFANFATDLGKFIRATCLQNLSESDLIMLDLEAEDCETIYQRNRKQAGAIPSSSLSEWEKIASDAQSDMAGGIFAWSFRVAVEEGLRWDDLLSSPQTH